VPCGAANGYWRFGVSWWLHPEGSTLSATLHHFGRLEFSEFEYSKGCCLFRTLRSLAVAQLLRFCTVAVNPQTPDSICWCVVTGRRQQLNGSVGSCLFRTPRSVAVAQLLRFCTVAVNPQSPDSICWCVVTGRKQQLNGSAGKAPCSLIAFLGVQLYAVQRSSFTLYCRAWYKVKSSEQIWQTQ